MGAVIARVEPLTTTRRLSGPFDYAPGDASLKVGSVVRVPFGHQALDGVVVGFAEHSEVAPERLQEPTSVRAEAIPPDLVGLALWMAEEYCSTRGAGAVARPAAARARRARGCGHSGPTARSTASG